MSFITQGKTNWKFLLIIVVLAIIVGVAILFYPEERKEPAPQEEIDTELTLEELKNAEYFAVEYDEKVQLKDGYYFKPWQPDSASGLSVEIYNDKIAFGDLDNDGKEDAAVILTTSGGGSGSFRSLVIMLNRDGKPWYLTEKSLGDRVVINSITIESGVITLNMIVHAPGDGLCCPSLEKTSQFRLFNNQLIEAETIDWQTYRNEEYGFEIKYPPGYALNTKVLFDLEPIEPFKGFYLTIEIIDKSPEEQKQFLKEEYLIPTSPFAKVLKEEKVTINNYEAEKIVLEAESGDIGDYFLLSHNDTNYQLGVTYLTLEYQAVFDQMLSTFRFIEITQVPENPDIDPAIVEALEERSEVPVIISARKQSTLGATDIDKVLATLAPGDFNLAYRWNNLWMFSGSLSSSGLDKLSTNPDVASVQLDVPVPPVDETCEDSDGGVNYYVQGFTNPCHCTEPPCPTCGAWIDKCLDENTLLEYSCDNLNGEEYVCPNGCEDGACLSQY